MNRLLTVLTWRPQSRRNRWIVTISLILALTLTTFALAKRAESYTSPLIHGVQSKCAIRMYGIYPYRSCYVVVQPGTTAEVQAYLKVQGPQVAAAVVAVATLLCTKFGVTVAAACGIIAGFYMNAVLTAFHDATAQHRCVRFDWHYATIAAAGPFLASASAYGAKARWIWITYKGLPLAYWGYPTLCQIPAPCVPIIGVSCMV